MPRIVFARALAVGVESLAEFVDLELEGRMNPSEVLSKLNENLPEGIRILQAEEVIFSSSASIDSSGYWVALDSLISKEDADSAVRAALAKRELLFDQERKGKRRRVDLRSFIEAMQIGERGP